jgi:hypothetical protein
MEDPLLIATCLYCLTLFYSNNKLYTYLKDYAARYIVVAVNDSIVAYYVV